MVSNDLKSFIFPERSEGFLLVSLIITRNNFIKTLKCIQSCASLKFRCPTRNSDMTNGEGLRAPCTFIRRATFKNYEQTLRRNKSHNFHITQCLHGI